MIGVFLTTVSSPIVLIEPSVTGMLLMDVWAWLRPDLSSVPVAFAFESMRISSFIEPTSFKLTADALLTSGFFPAYHRNVLELSLNNQKTLLSTTYTIV